MTTMNNSQLAQIDEFELDRVSGGQAIQVGPNGQNTNSEWSVGGGAIASGKSQTRTNEGYSADMTRKACREANPNTILGIPYGTNEKAAADCYLREQQKRKQ